MIEKKNCNRLETEERDQNKKEIEEMERSKHKIEEEDQNKLEEYTEDSLELMLVEQSRSQIRSDYRRSLGSENRRRYME